MPNLTFSGLILAIFFTYSAFAFTIPIGHLPKTVSVTKQSSFYVGVISSFIVESLFEYGENGVLVNSLAKTHRYLNNTTLVVSLKDRTFSDGSPVTSKDVVTSLHHCFLLRKDKTSDVLSAIDGFSDFLNGKEKNVRGLKVKGSRSLTIILNRPAPLLTYDLARRTCGIVKRNANKSDDLLNGAIGSGPYKLKSVNEREIILENRSSRALPDPIIFRLSNGEETAEITDKFDYFVSKEKMNLKKFNRFNYQQLGTHELVFNNSKEPFDDPRVRKAISLAVDKWSLARELGWPLNRIQQGLVPYGMAGFRPEKSRDLSQSIAKAIQLLNASGYQKTKPLKFKLLLRKGPKQNIEFAFWSNTFANLPVEANIRIVSTERLLNQAQKGTFQAIRLGKDPGGPDPYRLFQTYRDLSHWNTPRGNEPQCNLLIDKMINTQNLKQRFELYLKIDDCLVDQKNIVLPLSSLPMSYVYIKKPWQIARKNSFLIYPHRVGEWIRVK